MKDRGDKMTARKIKAAAKRKIHIRAKVKLTEQQKKERDAVHVEASAKKILFTRSEQTDGGFLMNYYYIREKDGTLVPEDIRSATHYERVYYDGDGNVLGSMIGELGGKVLW